MKRATARFLPASAGIVGLALILAACAKTDNAAPTGTTARPLATSTTTTLAPGQPQAACGDDILLPIVRVKFAEATLADKVCLVPNAVVTAKSPGSEAVVFLAQADGVWKIISDGPTADAAALAPKTFSNTLLNTWLDKRSPPPPTSARAPRSPVTTGERRCTGEGAGEICVTTPPPTAATTVTTARPVTTAPPAVTTPPSSTPPTTLSEFCRSRPLDPSCLPPR